MNTRITSYRDFWPFYLSQHSKKKTKTYHALGLFLAWVIGILIFLDYGYLGILAGLVVGYGFAWYSHFFIEKNVPATFQYPFWSFISDYRMTYWLLTGKLKQKHF